MRSTYNPIGSYVRQVKAKNIDGAVSTLRGVSIEKFYMPSVANINGVDLKKYKVVSPGQFAFNPMHVGRDRVLPISLLVNKESVIVSPAYTVFEITNKELLPEYLMMWFRRTEFDRYAWFKTDGNVRGGLSWDDFCEIEIPVPLPDEQQKVIDQYKSVTSRIRLNKQLDTKLEESAQAIYKHWFIDFEFPMTAKFAKSIGKPELAGKPYKSNGGTFATQSSIKQVIPVDWSVKKLVDVSDIKGGKRLPKDHSLTSETTDHPYIRVADMGKSKSVYRHNNFKYLSDRTYEFIKRYTVNTNDLIISIVGTIGQTRIIDSTLNGANLTENCVKVTNIQEVDSDYLFHYFNSSVGKQEIEMRTVGGVQGKLPIYNIEAIDVILPDKDTMLLFADRIAPINSKATLCLYEINYLEELEQLLLSKTSKMDIKI